MDMDGNEIAYWDSAQDILEVMGFVQSPILKCCRGERNKSYGYTWKFVQDQAAIDSIKKKRKTVYERNKFEILE